MNTRDLFPLYQVPNMRVFTDEELRICHTLGDAYEQTMKLSGLNRKKIADATGIKKEVLSMMCSGTRNAPAAKMMRFYEVCQNLYALQWQAYQFGKVLKDRVLSVEEKAELYDRMTA